MYVEKSQISTRNVVERTFGIWKRRFPALSLGIRTTPQTALIIITATAILHNILRRRNDIPPENEDDHTEIIEIQGGELPAVQLRESGNAVRLHFINSYFSGN